MADAGFDGKSKPWLRDKPFHRIGSAPGTTPPAFDPAAERVDGFGYGRGCWSRGADGPDDSVFSLLVRRLIRAVPGWVTVHPAEEIKEMEGELAHSFQTWTDVPTYQWHRWYDWNFHVKPIDGYKYLRGKGNYVGQLGSGETFIVEGETMECEWDTGSISRLVDTLDPNDPRPMNLRGPMFEADWAWPQKGQYFWSTGRWIYDCGHPVPDQTRQADKDAEDDKQPPKPGLHATELHPCRAIATVRFEAFKFKENTLLVPAVQFMFFASRLGGYHTYNELASDDYTFIVDLPKLDAVRPVWTIGHTTDFPLNTAVLRTRKFLTHSNFAPFTAVLGSFPQIEPIVEPIVPEGGDPLAQPEQVKVTLPLKGKQLTSYGVILSLGWEDPDQSLARKVKRVTVSVKNIRVGDDNHENFLTDIGGGRWVIKYAVNGRWKMVIFPSVDEEQILPVNIRHRFHLSDDDPIRVSIHGFEQDGVGNFLERNSEPDRVLFFEGKRVSYQRDVLTADRSTAQRLTVALAEATAGSLGNENDPLGLADAVEIVRTLPPGQTLERRLTAFHTDEQGGTAILFRTRTVDYTLNYSLLVEPQEGLPT